MKVTNFGAKLTLLASICVFGVSGFADTNVILPISCNDAMEGATVLTEPQPLNTFFELYEMSYPHGVKAGALYHIRPRTNALRKARLLEADLKQETELNTHTASLYRSLAFEVSHDSIVGEYWSSVPSPELLQTLGARWNATHHDPRQKIAVNFATTGADVQIKMVKLWLNNFIFGIADPLKSNTEFYIPEGRFAPTRDEMNTIEIEPHTGRVNEQNALFQHDLGHVVNTIHLSKEFLDATVPVTAFYADVYKILRSRTQSKLITGSDVAIHNRIYRSQNVLPRPTAQMTEDGEDPLTYFLIELHHSQRAVHSLAHILSWLIQRPEGLSAQNLPDLKRGSTFQIEIYIHLAGLGQKPRNKPPVSAWPILQINWMEASDDGKPVTLESAMDKIINGDIDRAERLTQRLNDPEITALFQKYNFRKTPASTLAQWGQLMRDRYYTFMR